MNESEQYFKVLVESYVVTIIELGSYKESISRPEKNVLAQIFSLPRMEIEEFKDYLMLYLLSAKTNNRYLTVELSLYVCSSLQPGLLKNSTHACVTTDEPKLHAETL